MVKPGIKKLPAVSIPEWHRNIYVALLLFITFVAFFPVLSAGFLNWDDQEFVYKNAAVLGFDVGSILTQSVLGLYIPLTTLSFAIEKAIFGLSPFVFHLNNLLLHMGIAVLLMSFFIEMKAGVRAAFLGALIFAVHPMHVESVAWVSERKDVLYALFYVLALRQWWMYLNKRRRVNFFLTILFGVLSLLAKPMAISLPLVMFFMEYWRKGSIRWVRWVSYVPMFLAALVLGYMTYSQHMRNPVAELGVSVLIWLWTLGFYLWKFLLPFSFDPLYALPTPVSIFHPAYALTCLGLLLLAGWLWYMAVMRRDRWILWATGFFFLSIFFLLRFDAQDAQVVADRFMYLPSAGICLWLGIKGDEAVTRHGVKAAIIVVVAVIVLVLSTFLYARIWKDNVTLWSYVIGRYPTQELALHNRAVAYGEMGRYDLAITDHNKALMFSSHKPIALYNRATDYRDWAKEKVKAREYGEADRLYRSALKDLDESVRLDPGHAASYNKRAMIRYYLKDEAGAIEDLGQAIEKAPDDFEAYNNRGNMLAIKGELDRALDDYRRALELGAEGPAAYSNIGIIYIRKGYPDLALQSFNKAIAIDPRHAEAYFNRSVLERQKGDRRAALADALRARSLGADFNEDYLRSLQDEIKKQGVVSPQKN